MCYEDEFESEVIRRGMVSALDSAIGRLVDQLERTGQYNNTVIVFSSDSGSGTFKSIFLDIN